MHPEISLKKSKSSYKGKKRMRLYSASPSVSIQYTASQTQHHSTNKIQLHCSGDYLILNYL